MINTMKTQKDITKQEARQQKGDKTPQEDIFPFALSTRVPRYNEAAKILRIARLGMT